MELKHLIKLLKVIRVFAWIAFAFMVILCVASCISSLEDYDWHPEGLLWEGCMWDILGMLFYLFIAIYLKPMKKSKEVDSNGLQK